MRTPKMFLAPVIGLIFLKSGLIALSDGLSDTWATFTSRPAAAHMAASGATVLEDRVQERREQRMESGGAGGVVRVGDLRERRAHRAGHAGDDRRADGEQTDQPGREHDRAVEVGALGDLALLAGLVLLLGCRLLCLVVIGHRGSVRLEGVQRGGDRGVDLVLHPAAEERQRGGDRRAARRRSSSGRRPRTRSSAERPSRPSRTRRR